MIKITKRVEEFEITVEADAPLGKENLDIILRELGRKRVYKSEDKQ